MKYQGLGLIFTIFFITPIGYMYGQIIKKIGEWEAAFSQEKHFVSMRYMTMRYVIILLYGHMG